MPTESDLNLLVDVSLQRLTVRDGEQVLAEYPVSTAANGLGEKEGSECTPKGLHCIAEKIGDGEPEGAVFVGRQPTGEVYSSDLAEEHPDRDWILSRILWLSGQEVGINRLGHVDSLHRYIYIHGTPDSEPMGEPRSHGCIRMRNSDVIELFDKVDVGTKVMITQS
ncbi:MAG: L,D-transpeptidase family protein [Gammaproteobacteria bacterium]